MYTQNDFMAYLNGANTPTAYSKPKTRTNTAVRPTAPKGPVLVSSFVEAAAQIPAQPTTPVPAPVPVTTPALELIRYSERSFAIFGDTKPLQAQLEGLGGKFNRWLKRDGISTPGFIFSIGRIDNVRKAINI